MQERILFAPGVSSTELLRTLARKGVNTFGLRVVNGAELAGLALMRTGIAADYAFLSGDDRAYYYQNEFGEGSEPEAPTGKLFDTLDSLRLLITENESDTIRKLLPQGEFKEKNEKLLELYDNYMRYCDDPCGKPGYWDGIFIEGVDHVRWKDAISVMRLALEKAEPIKAQIIILQEYPLSPLEKRLAEKLAGEGVKEVPLAELFGRVKSAPKIDSVTAAYGSSNEVEDIIGRIYEQKIPLDNCTIAVADPAVYSQLFYEYAVRYDIPVTFGCGIPAVNSNPAKLLKLHHEWQTHGCGGVDALRDLLYSDAFDRDKFLSIFHKRHPGFDDFNSVIELAGSLKLGLDMKDGEFDCCSALLDRLDKYRNTLKNLSDKNEKARKQAVADCAEALAVRLIMGSFGFALRYSRIRSGLQGQVDRAAANEIGKLARQNSVFGRLSRHEPVFGRRVDDALIDSIMSSRVCFEASCEGHLHITSISDAMSSMREHLFVAGMSAANFPGKPTENFLLLDDDYLMFSKDPSVPTSYNLVQKKRQSFFDLMELAGALDVPVDISYPDADLAALKNTNPSSVLYELLGTDDISGRARKAEFFDHILSPISAVGAKYLEGAIISQQEPQTPSEPKNAKIDRVFSPTNIETYITCPRRFWLNVILRIKQPEEDDPTEIISAAEMGTLVHELMEYYKKGLPDYDVFICRANRMFDDYLLKRHPFNETDIPAVRREFIDIARKAYCNDPGNKVFAAELDIEAKLSGGIRLKGRADRVEMDQNGELLIVDYKTSSSISHIENDAESCMQALLYAAMLEQNGMKVNRCEYRYLRKEKSIGCRYDDNVKAQLDGILDKFGEALETSDFPASADKPGEDDICKFCPVKSVCKTEVR